MVVEWDQFPAACPKCGQEMRQGFDETFEQRLDRHVRTAHPGAIGTATRPFRQPVEFCYVRPVYYRTEPTWLVILLEPGSKRVWLVELKPSEWAITWPSQIGPDPTAP